MTISAAAAFANAFADFGLAATVGGVSVFGIFDAEYANAFDVVAGSTPVLLVRSADVPAVTRGDAVVLNATSYTVADIQPDGQGLTRLILEAV